MIGSVSTMAAATIINVAFPALLREFHVGHDSLQWVATGFLAATTSTMLATAWLVESFGQRKTFMVTLAVFLAASLLGAVAWNTGALIAARVLQGAATGIMQPLCMIALFEVFPPHRRGAAMGMFGFGVVLVPAIGPTIGGLLVEAFGWRSIFLMPVPFCVAALALATRFLPRGTIRNPRNPFDWTGSALLGAALVALLNVPVIGHRMGWNSLALAASVAVTVGLATAFIWWEFRARAPLLALRLFAVRGFRSATLVSFAYGVGLFGTTYLIPVFVQDIAAYTPTQAGYLLLWPGVLLGITIVLAGRLTDRVDPRWIVALGLAFFALSSVLLVFSGAAHQLRRAGALVDHRTDRPGHDHPGAQRRSCTDACAGTCRVCRVVGQLRAAAWGCHRGQPARRPARVAPPGSRRKWGSDSGLPRMLLGGYDRICRGHHPRAGHPSTHVKGDDAKELGMYRKILVAYNGTPESRSALDELVRFAPDPSAEVHLAGVVHYPSAYLLAGEYVPEVALADEREHMEADLKEAHAHLAGKGLTVTDHLVVGEPVDVLTKLVTELGIELLILGHPRSRSFAMRWWRGSVDAVLIERVRCSILVASGTVRS